MLSIHARNMLSHVCNCLNCQPFLNTIDVMLTGFRGTPKPVAKDKDKEREKEKDKSPAHSESSHEMSQQPKAERAKWYAIPPCCPVWHCYAVIHSWLPVA